MTYVDKYSQHWNEPMECDTFFLCSFIWFESLGNDVSSPHAQNWKCKWYYLKKYNNFYSC